MERVTNREFGATGRTVLLSTGPGHNDDRLHPDALVFMKEHLANEPEKRLIYLGQDYENPVGEVSDMWIEEDEEGVSYLYGELGIFNGREDILQKIESNTLGPLNLSYHVYENCEKEYWESRIPEFALSVDDSDWKSVNDALVNTDVAYRIEFHTTADAKATFEFTSLNWRTIEKLVVLILIWAINRRGDGFEFSPTINLLNVESTINIESLLESVETKLELEESSEEDTIHEIVRDELEKFDEAEE